MPAVISNRMAGFEREAPAQFQPLDLNSTLMNDPNNSTSVLDAIKDGHWNFEPMVAGQHEYDATSALPGSDEKLDMLAERVRGGLPLWHPLDRRTYEDLDLGD